MSYDVVTYERGQIWYIKFKHPLENAGREQAKDRPWLILSIGKFNKTSGMITAVPLTTRDRIVSPAQVLIDGLNGQKNVILCEQIRSFDYMSGNYILEYRGVVSPEVMEKVDVALSIHTGMHYSPITLKSLYDSMEAIIKSVGHMQAKANTPKFNDDDVIEFATKLQELAGTEVAATSVSEKVVTPIKCNPPQKKSGEDVSKVSHESKTERRKWTRETCEEFLHDATTLPMKKVMEKWNISKKPRYYSMKNYAQSVLMKKE